MDKDSTTPRYPASRWRRATTVVAFAAAFSVAVAACGDDDDTNTTPTTETTVTQEASPSAEASTTQMASPSAEASATEGASPTAGASPTEGTVQLPDNAQDYADAAFQAWLDGRTSSLEAMALADVVSTLEANTPGDPSNWSMSGCDAATGHVECTFSSTAGKTLTLLVDNALASAGREDAVIEARFS